MPHEVHASIVVTLPDEPKDMVGTLGKIANAWALLLAEISTMPMPVPVQTFTVNETRTKPASSGAKRGRKPRTEASDTVPTSELAGLLA